ncbi:MAG: MFS transporter [Dehalococcoidia bacterium]|uniref:MFS transporter n=1 Tax=Candidatus Amarobacter glycogenicus TaxID=3140699 RepID=UPI0031368A20|nr:MFS transporter [Dehalococcoidia bacterium]
MAQQQGAMRPAGGPPMGPPGQKPSFRAALSVFGNRNYRYLWVSSLFSFTGMQMQQVARALLAWQLTHSYGSIGLISLSFGLPMLCFSLVGGSLADRFEKRNLTLVSQFVTALLAVVNALMLVTDTITIEWLFLLGLGGGTAMALGMPARSPLMAQVVGPQHVMSAMAMSNAAMNATRLFGPAVAGVMVATINLESVYFLQAGLYVVSCGLLLFVPTGLGAASAVARGNMFREIGNGLAYVARDSRLRQLNISMLAISFFAMPYVMLLAGFVHEDLGKGDAAFGFLQSVSGVGALVGSLAVATLTAYDRKTLLQWVAGITGGLGLVLLALGSRSFGYPGAIGAVLVLGLALTAYQTLNSTLIMDAARPEFYGRVMSINMLSFSAMPLMAFPLGRVADSVGATNLFIAQGVIVAGIMVAIALLNPAHTFGRAAPVERPPFMPGRPMHPGAPERVEDVAPAGGK